MTQQTRTVDSQCFLCRQGKMYLGGYSEDGPTAVIEGIRRVLYPIYCPLCGATAFLWKLGNLPNPETLVGGVNP